MMSPRQDQNIAQEVWWSTIKKIPDDVSGMNDESVNLLDDQLDLPNISILNEEEWKTIIEEKR